MKYSEELVQFGIVSFTALLLLGELFYWVFNGTYYSANQSVGMIVILGVEVTFAAIIIGLVSGYDQKKER